MTVYEETIRAQLTSLRRSLEHARDALEPPFVIELLEHQIAFVTQMLRDA